MAPYNFIPLNEKVVEAENIPDFDKYHDNMYTGYIDLKIKTLTPLYIRDTLTEEEYIKIRCGGKRRKNEKLYIRLAMPLTTVLESFYKLWIKLAIAFVIVFVIAYLIAQQMSHRVVYDIKQLKVYLEEVSSKNYEAVVHIKYIQEFLELSLILKNIIKRLQKKDKKK